MGVITSKMTGHGASRSFYGKKPIFLEIRSSTWFITATVCTAIFTDIWLYAVVVPVFPFSLRERMGVPESQVQHWLSVLLAVFAASSLIGSPIFGFLCDKVQYRRWPLLAGLIAVMGATILLCLAPSLPLLILGRILQGLSAAMIWVVGLALLADTFDGDEIATAVGFVGTAYSLASLLAPLLGGIVYDKSGYYAVFAMCFGVIALDTFLRLAMIEKKVARKWLELDQVQEQQTEAEIEDSIGRAPEIQHDPEKSNTHQEISTTEPKSKHKMPAIVSLWSSRRMLSAFWGVLVLASLMTGFDTVLTLFVNRTFGWNSLAAGVLFLAPLLPSFFQPVIGKYVDKYGSRWIGAFGLIFAAPFLVLLRLVDHNSINQKVLLAALLTLVGVGAACSLTALVAEYSRVCDAKEKANPGIFGKHGAYAQTYSILNMSWAAGSLVGAFWSGGIYSKAGWNTLTWTWALLCGLSAVPVLLFTDGWVGKSGVGTWRKTTSPKAGKPASPANDV